ncbi:CCA tRNA nucleotidyltransferase [Candidatus Bipolaricaulota bacterium]|nr:CCA tRNA nucleotidyltransferase [Candidatus Bipolaricaulota bacterium]TFH10807.1 MAG: CCA tRNA nucleotidyltransferase [Candidatus Atribacteria bacterium]
MGIVIQTMTQLTSIPTDKVYDAHPFAREILTRLQSAGFEAVLIGGVVRDGLQAQLGRDVVFPPSDIDIATSALPREIRRVFHDRPIVGVGEEFGVLLIVDPLGHAYEVASFRVESEYDGRWPAKVELVRDLETDVRRRDLTINGLAATADGEVIDWVGGTQDLAARRVRTIGEPGARFSEDYLRMMRAVRFTCRIDGEMDAATAQAVRDHAQQIQSISAERIGDELLRILKTQQAARGMELLDSLGLLRFILPELSACQGVAQPEEYHPEGDVFVHTIQAVAVADGFVLDPIVKLAIVLHDIGKPVALQRNDGRNMGGHCAIGARMAKDVGRRLRLSRLQTQRLCDLVRQHMRIADFPKMGRGKQVRFLSDGGDPEASTLPAKYSQFYDLLQVLVSDCEASVHRSSGWAPIFQETLRVMDHIERVCGLQHAREMINGHDLTQQLGLTPGPQLGRILAQVHDRILAGHIVSRDEAFALAQLLRDDEAPSSSVRTTGKT